MLIDIREVERCRNGAYANFLARGKYPKKYWVITISKSKNKLLADWASSVLHELLHAWVTAIRLRGFKVRGIKEHKFIYGVEDKIHYMLKHLKPMKKNCNRKRRKK